LQAPKPGLAQSVFGLVARIDASGIAVPEIDKHTFHWLTGIDIDDLYIEEEIELWLGFTDILTNELAGDVWGGDTVSQPILKSKRGFF